MKSISTIIITRTDENGNTIENKVQVDTEAVFDAAVVLGHARLDAEKAGKTVPSEYRILENALYRAGKTYTEGARNTQEGKG